MKDKKECPFTEEELQSAAAEVRVTMLGSMPRPSDCEREFSDEFCAKMDGIMKAERRKKRRELLLRSLAAVVCVALLLWLASRLGAA